MDGNIKIREKSKITAFLFLFSFLFFPVVIAVPHPIIGYHYDSTDNSYWINFH